MVKINVLSRSSNDYERETKHDIEKVIVYMYYK